MEAALILRKIENGQCLHFCKDIIVHPRLPNQPMPTLFPISFIQFFFKGCRRFRGENLIQTHTNRITLSQPQRIVLCLTKGLKVHIQLIFRQRTRHQLSVTAQYIATSGLHTHTVFLHPVCYFKPVITLSCHDISRLSQHTYRDNDHRSHNKAVTRHYLFRIKLTHSSGTLIIYGGCVAIFNVVSLLALSMFNTLLSRLFSVSWLLLDNALYFASCSSLFNLSSSISFCW